MKLTIGQAHDLYVGLSTVDRDDGCKLDGKTRIAIAIDLNLLRPHVAGYEQVRSRTLVELAGGGRGVGTDAALFLADADLRAMEIELALKTIAVGDLHLDQNSRITGALIAALAPVLTGLE